MSEPTEHEKEMKAMLTNMMSKFDQIERRFETLEGRTAQVETAPDDARVPQTETDHQPLTPEQSKLVAMLHDRVSAFIYDAEDGETFDEWFERYRDLIEGTGVPENAIVQLIMLKLSPAEHKQFTNHILPLKPREMTLAAVLKQLGALFGRKKTLFRTRHECMHLVKSPVDDYTKHVSVVNAACQDFKLNELTLDQFKCLIYINSLRNMEDESIRAWVLRALDKNQRMSLEDVASEIQRYNDIRSDNKLLESAATVNHVSRPLKKEGRSRKPNFVHDKCKYCGGAAHSKEHCPAVQATCRKCQKVGHYASVCMQTSHAKKHLKQSAHTMKVTDSLSMSRRYVKLRVNGAPVRLLLDTGSDLTMICEATWKRLGRPNLKPPGVTATAANGEQLDIYGSFECKASYQDEHLTGIVFVTGKLNLLGLDWLERFPSFRSMFDAVCNRVSVNSSDKPSTSATATTGRFYLQALQKQFADVFSTGLGLCKKTKVSLQLKEGARPVYRPSRKVSFHFKESVDNELDRLEQLGVIERVDYSPWTAPILCVREANGKIRVCVDFSTGLNDALEDHIYPIPTADEIMTTLNGGTVFSTLDFADAYLQIELEDDSKDLLAINTHRGIYRYNRLCFGVKTAPAIFQQIMDAMISGLNGCCAYLDDVIVSGKNAKEHNANLEACLQRVSEFGFHVNFEKCTFAASEIRYLGMKISREGRMSDPDKIEPILKMPAPKDVSQLRSFVGKINYYGRFLESLHDLRAPFDHLMKKDVKWNWSEECQNAFEEIKKKVASPLLLTHYDPKKELLLVTDASQYGLGAVILHKLPDGTQKAVEHASRTLNPAEKNYGQIEKEGLAIFWALKKFYRYLMGRKFTIVTDHKPLVSIFGSKKGIPVVTANRLQRWATYMLGFDFKIEFKPTGDMGCADVLSRLIPKRSSGEEMVIATVESESTTLQESYLRTIAALPLTATMIRDATEKDKMLQAVLQCHRTGSWPGKLSSDMNEFSKRRSALSEMDGILLNADRVVIPAVLKGRMMRQLHQGHQGIVRTKSLARELVYWPSIDKDIEVMIKACDSCGRAQKNPVKTKLESWDRPERSWQRVHADFAGPLEGKFYLVVVDALSKWTEIVSMDRITTSATITQLKRIFAQFGMPDTLVTDNGTQFTSAEFALFCAKNGIEHVRSPPFHPQSNGQAERFVDTFKRALLKLRGEGTPAENLQTFLLSYRMTPSSSVPNGLSPAEVFLGRKLRTALNLVRPKPEKVVIKDKRMEEQFNKKHGSKTKDFNPGDLVYARDFKNPQKPTWMEAKIVKTIGNVLYDVEVAGQRRPIRRHANQLRPRSSLNSTRSLDVILDTFDLPMPSFTQNHELSQTVVAENGIMDHIVEDVADDAPIAAAAVDPDEDKDNAAAAAPPVVNVPVSPPRRSARTRQPPKRMDMNPNNKTYC